MFRTLLAAALTLGLAAATPAWADEMKMQRTIALTGHGEVRQAPDLATVTAGVVSQAATAKDALAANTADMERVMAALKAAGIAEKDIQTSNFTVQPRYDYSKDGRAPSLAGYDVSNTVSVTLRQLDMLGTVLDQLVQSGANQINGVSFGIDKPDEALDEARKQALADARHKAEIYAAAGGVSIGKLITIVEGGGYTPPAPVMRARVMALDQAAPVPIAAGEQVLAIDVNVTWELE
jgi:uncharacterized protein YggE